MSRQNRGGSAIPADGYAVDGFFIVGAQMRRAGQVANDIFCRAQRVIGQVLAREKQLFLDAVQRHQAAVDRDQAFDAVACGMGQKGNAGDEFLVFRPFAIAIGRVGQVFAACRVQGMLEGGGNRRQAAFGVVQAEGIVAVEAAEIDALLIDAPECRQVAEHGHEEIQGDAVAIGKGTDCAHLHIELCQTCGNIGCADDETVVVEDGVVPVAVVIQYQPGDVLAEALAFVGAGHGSRAMADRRLMHPVLKQYPVDPGKQHGQIGDALALVMGDGRFRFLFQDGQ